MKTIFSILALVLFTAVSIFGQVENWSSIIQQSHSHGNVSAQLLQLAKYAQVDFQSALQKAKDFGLLSRSDGKVYIEIQYGWDPNEAGDLNQLLNDSFEFEAAAKNLVGGWIALTDLISFSESIADPKFLLTTGTNWENTHEGVAATGADLWQTNGAYGSGIKIAIIDDGYSSLSAAQAAGNAPATYVQSDFTSTGDPFESGGVHGTGQVETVYAYASAADYYLMKAETTVQFSQAVTQAIAFGVDMIIRSASFFNTGWADNSGTACSIVEDATNAGIFFLNGAGNHHERHAQDEFVDSDGDLLHNWTSSANGSLTTVDAGKSFSVYLQWIGTPNVINNFDLQLRMGNVIVAQSNATNGFEKLSWTNNTMFTQDVKIEVKRTSGTNKKFEIFTAGQGGYDINFNSLENSTASPANCTAEYCLTSSVVDWSEYSLNSPQLYATCSRGPTNGGNAAIDFCTLTGITLTSYPSGLFGSSAGAPALAGIMAILWSEHSYLSADGLLELVKGLAKAHNDWGTPGIDDKYGHGAPRFPAYLANSYFIIEDVDNSANSLNLPFESVQQANSLAPSDSNIFFLGGTYDAPPTGQGLLDKKMLYKSSGSDAQIAQ